MVIEADSNYDCLICAKKKHPGNGSLYLKAGQRNRRTNAVARLDRRDRKASKGKMPHRKNCSTCKSKGYWFGSQSFEGEALTACYATLFTPC
jgi:hypothetical protein